MIGLIGRKIGMTQIYKENGEICPATVLEVGPCPVVQVKTAEGKDRYNAVKLGFWESRKVSKPIKGIVSKLGLPGVKVLSEFRVNNIADYLAGSVLKADVFAVGDTVIVSGTMKGRGFAGVTKRHRFKGGDDTHGCRAKRIPGSMGGSSDPSRIFKGKKLPGHYGAVKNTVKGLEVLVVDPENNVIFVKGAVPGPRKGIIFVTKQV
ncbi:50S ribosomal protein L3 [bacterium]|nr:50S ribosomal protein L3 [bacterium]